jgi:hypothetical protein
MIAQDIERTRVFRGNVVSGNTVQVKQNPCALKGLWKICTKAELPVQGTNASCTRRGAEYHSAPPWERRVALAEARSTTPRSMGAASRRVQLRGPMEAASCTRRGAEYHSAIHGSGELYSPRHGVPLRDPWERRVVLAGARSTTPRSHGSGELHSPTHGVPLRGPWERRVALAGARSATPRSHGSGELHSPRRGVQLRGPMGSGELYSPRRGVQLRDPWERRVALADARSTTPRSMGAASCTRRGAECHSAVHGSGELHSPRRGVPLRGPMGAASCTRRGAECHSAVPWERRVVLAEARSATPRSHGSGELHSPRRGVQLRGPMGSGELYSPRRGVQLRDPWERRVALADARSTTPRSMGAASCTRRGAECHSAVHGSGELHSPRRGVPLRGPMGAASCTRRGAECHSAVPWERRVVLAEARSVTPRSMGAASCTCRGAECNAAVPWERRVALAGARSATPRSHGERRVALADARSATPRSMGAASCTRRGAECNAAVPWGAASDARSGRLARPRFSGIGSGIGFVRSFPFRGRDAVAHNDASH